MEPRDRPTDFAAIVGAHHREARAFLLATSEHCAEVRDREVEVVRRNLEVVDPAALLDLEPEGSWVLAVLVCPGDTVEAVARWAAELPAEALQRVLIYLRTDVDTVAALAPWYAADLPNPYTADFTDWAGFHKQFGADFNNQVYRDFA